MNAIPIPPPDAAYVSEHPLTKFMYYSFETNQYYYWNNTDWVAMSVGGTATSGTDVYLFSSSVSLTETGVHEISLPPNKILFPTQCGFVIKESNEYNPGAALEWRFKTLSEDIPYIDTLHFFVSGSVNERATFPLPNGTDKAATQNLSFTVVTPAEATVLNGIAFFKGLLLDA